MGVKAPYEGISRSGEEQEAQPDPWIPGAIRRGLKWTHFGGPQGPDPEVQIQIQGLDPIDRSEVPDPDRGSRS